jgi:DNA-binding response OmpR family regulator
VALRLLLLEDDAKISRVITQIFSEEGYSVDLCTTGADAIRQGGVGNYSLMVFDWMVPDIDGLEACRELRRAGVSTPVLILTARDSVPERVLGLDAGADDYVTKPFEMPELLARARALVRRAGGIGRARCGDIELDPIGRRATLGQRALHLTDREFDVLYRLLERADSVVTRTELLAHVWESPGTGSNVVEVHINRLREKLGAQKWMIETVRGQGYRLRSHPSQET